MFPNPLSQIFARFSRRARDKPGHGSRPPVVLPEAMKIPKRAAPPCPAQGSDDADALVESLLAQSRYAMLLRPQLAGKIDHRQFERALRALEDEMALVPDGAVVLHQAFHGLEDASGDEDSGGAAGRVVHVERYFCDRHPITNEQFFEFVTAGAYADPSLWDPMILPALLTFVDQSGEPGPRYWREGRYDLEKRLHPVVGVSWYEASAYARWVGKRLPTDAEWVKSGSWPINLSGQGIVQRRFPWGDVMDRSRVNLWGSRANDTAAVDDFPEGASVGGICQLIGNVWEWTANDFPPPDNVGPPLVVETPMKSLRGGAFDTYFDSQASCAFQSGDAAIARKANIGFRCALSVRDLKSANGAPCAGSQSDARLGALTGGPA
jgi:iron(II)-dependent oxidoreductase